MLAVLSDAKITGNALALSEQKLDRKLYMATNKVVEEQSR